MFLVVENQMIAEMDKKLKSSLEIHLKKGQFKFAAFICFCIVHLPFGLSHFSLDTPSAHILMML